ncbi:MAG TPA: hypothetical protein VHB48_11310 [Chitinophagaceae bacterium]|nr:hypothetical protein [Chitinophagaceae bacterium]
MNIDKIKTLGELKEGRKLLLLPLVITILVCHPVSGYAQQDINHGQNFASCVLLSSDSVAYYVGKSSIMTDYYLGDISKPDFAQLLYTNILNHKADTSFRVAIKISNAGSVTKTYVDFKKLLAKWNMQYPFTFIDSLETDDIQRFHVATMPGIIEDLLHRPQIVPPPKERLSVKKS